jgi:hypothetical protein
MLNKLLKTTKIMLKWKKFTRTHTHTHTHTQKNLHYVSQKNFSITICPPEEFFQSFLRSQRLIYAILTPENYKSN